MNGIISLSKVIPTYVNSLLFHRVYITFMVYPIQGLNAACRAEFQGTPYTAVLHRALKKDADLS